MPHKTLYVTQPDLPPLAEFTSCLEKIWESKVLTNGGPFHQQFEEHLAKYLGVDYISVFTNGTLALITAIHALGLEGEVITTPFSFVATSHALLFNNIKPVFVDIDPVTFNLDPQKVEAAITSDTTAILPVHIFGTPCDFTLLQEIADRHSLKIIYDAAHAFGVRMNGESILKHGDLSVLSFHATKVFNTFEGGAIICKDPAMKTRIDQLKNFGITSETTMSGPGINGKMNEMQAAFGLVQLNHLDSYISKRKLVAAHYSEMLKDVSGITFLPAVENVEYNYNYLPVLVNQAEFGYSRDQLYEMLKQAGIYARRYFYPLITDFSPYKELELIQMEISTRISEQVLCLPIYSDLSLLDIGRVCDIIMQKGYV